MYAHHSGRRAHTGAVVPVVGSIRGLVPGLGAQGVDRQQWAPCGLQPCQRCQCSMALKLLRPLVLCEGPKLQAGCTRGYRGAYERLKHTEPCAVTASLSLRRSWQCQSSLHKQNDPCPALALHNSRRGLTNVRRRLYTQTARCMSLAIETTQAMGVARRFSVCT